MQEITIGTRRIQRVAGAHTVNVPAMIVRAFDLHPGDAMRWTITSDGKLRIEQLKGLWGRSLVLLFQKGPFKHCKAKRRSRFAVSFYLIQEDINGKTKRHQEKC